ncbi:MAG TPA: hypothetical protein VID48_04075 [Solirubrobacteraceae bacterium]
MVTGVLPGLLRFVSRVICLIVIASFVIFAVHKTSNASKGQQRALSGESAPSGASSKTGEKPSTLHKVIDEASEELTSPFSGITSGSSNQWVIRIVNMLLALVVYGFGLSFLARVLRLKV